MTYLITGATGFIGQAVVALMHDRGYEVLPVVRRAAGLPNEVVIPHLDLDTYWTEALVGCRTVIHLAARTHVMKEEASDPLVEFRKVNVHGTLTLARQAAQAGVERFVFVSSIKVNGERTELGLPFRADTPPAPEDAYGISKYEAEQALTALARETGMDLVIIRPPLVYGPGVKGNFSTMVRWVRNGIPLPLGAVDNQRSLVGLDNLASFIALCAVPECSPRAANQIFLVSDGEDVSTARLLRKVAHAYRTPPRLLPVPVNWLRSAAGLLGKAAMADRLLGSLVIDSSKAQELLGWKSVVPMDMQLEKIAFHDTHN